MVFHDANLVGVSCSMTSVSLWIPSYKLFLMSSLPLLSLPCRDTFLRSLAAAQWDKKRKSKHLSEAKQPLSDGITTQEVPPAEEGEGLSPEDLSGRAAIVGKQAVDQ